MASQHLEVVLNRVDGHRETIKIDLRKLCGRGVEATPDLLKNAAFGEELERQILLRDPKGDHRISGVNFTTFLPGYGLRQAALERDETTEADISFRDGGRQISRCRVLLELAKFALPRSVREDTLDEWMDEIYCAAEDGQPFRRRILSILFHSLPKQALRARFPVRARRGEG